MIERTPPYPYGLNGKRALCTLADYEGPIKRALTECEEGGSDWDHKRICEALRWLVDGP